MEEGQNQEAKKTVRRYVVIEAKELWATDSLEALELVRVGEGRTIIIRSDEVKPVEKFDIFLQRLSS